MKKWYALDVRGDMVYLGEFEDFSAADDASNYAHTWIADEEIARSWLDQLTKMLNPEEPA